MKVKKSFEEVIKFLEANQNKKVSALLPELLTMCESRKQSSACIKDSDGNVLAIYCYYHKQWEVVADVEYGSKVNSTTGLNTMCKIGTSMWTKKLNQSKKAKASLIDEVAIGNILPGDIQGHMLDIDSERNKIDTTDMPTGYQSEEDVRKALNL